MRAFQEVHPDAKDWRWDTETSDLVSRPKGTIRRVIDLRTGHGHEHFLFNDRTAPSKECAIRAYILLLLMSANVHYRKIAAAFQLSA